MCRMKMAFFMTSEIMASGGKSLTFEPEEIEELVSMQYGDKRLRQISAPRRRLADQPPQSQPPVLSCSG